MLPHRLGVAYAPRANLSVTRALGDAFRFKSRPARIAGWTVGQAREAMKAAVADDQNAANWEVSHLAQERVRTQMAIFRKRFFQGEPMPPLPALPLPPLAFSTLKCHRDTAANSTSSLHSFISA